MSEGSEQPRPGASENDVPRGKDDSKTGIVIGLVMFGSILVLMIVAQLLRT
ncbi:MAG TPA: hypothetical protein VNK52_09320 [Hyphomicrobiaceae bacterium]|nr:hypothetical protein [Hyphomicrobiaceae bacterium]